MVIEGQTLLREAVVSWLRRDTEFDVIGQASGYADGLRTAREKEPALVLLDLGLPDGQALSLIRELGSEDSSPRVIALAGENELGQAVTCYAEGVAGVVAKSGPLAEVVAALETVAAGGRYLPPALASELATGFLDRSLSRAPLDSITVREREVLEALASGASNREIAASMGLSVRTIDTHRTNLLRKLDARNNAELTRIAIRCRLVDP